MPKKFSPGWVGGLKSRFKDCLRQSKPLIFVYRKGVSIGIIFCDSHLLMLLILATHTISWLLFYTYLEKCFRTFFNSKSFWRKKCQISRTKMFKKLSVVFYVKNICQKLFNFSSKLIKYLSSNQVIFPSLWLTTERWHYNQ